MQQSLWRQPCISYGRGNHFCCSGMILSVCKAGDKIILPRNVHKSAINALVLCGAVPVYVNPEVNGDLGISLGMDIRKVEKAIEENPDAVAVLVNNPLTTGSVLTCVGS